MYLIPLPIVLLLIVTAALFAYIYKGSEASNSLLMLIRRIGLVKYYWKFVTFYSLLLCVVYYLTFKYVPSTEQGKALDFIGQIAAIVFAIFIGWFAFLEVKRSTLKEGVERANQYFTSNRSLQRARQLYEEYCDFEQTDFFRLTELLEIYLVLGSYEKAFEERFARLKKNVKDDWEGFMPLYLECTKHLFKEEIKSAENKLKEMVDYAAKNPEALGTLSWDFRDIKKAAAYKKFTDDREAKKLFDRMILYLSNDAAVKVDFEKHKFL